MFPQPTGSGFSGRAGSDPSFSDSIAGLLGRIDARRADSAEQREAVFRLRYDAYRREGVIPASPSATFSDAYDRTPNAYLFGLYMEGKLATSIRIHVASKEYPDCPTLHVFPEYLQPELDAGKIIIDPTRFVADEDLARLHVGLPYVTLRLCHLAAEYFHADIALAAVRVEHQAFYRRAFNYQLLCEARPYPLLAKPISLMAIHYPAIAEVAHRRHPFFRSTYAERRMLFARPGSLQMPPPGAATSEAPSHPAAT
jgi:N-acyl-L-homoserine lactone synthetase